MKVRIESDLTFYIDHSNGVALRRRSPCLQATTYSAYASDHVGLMEC